MMCFFLLVSFVPLSIMTVFSYVSTYTAVREATASEIQNTLIQIAKNLESKLNLIDKYSKNIALSIQLRQLLLSDNFDRSKFSTIETWKSLDEIVQPAVHDENMFRSLYLFKGLDPVYNYGSGFLDAEPFIHSGILEEILEGKGQLYKGIYTHATTSDKEETLMVFGRALQDFNYKNGEPYGAMVIFMDELTFAGVYNKQSFTDGELFYITDMRGIVISSRNKENLAKDITGESFYEKILELEKTAGYFLLPVDGSEMLVIYQAIPGWNYRVIQLMSSVTLKKSGNRILYLSFIQLGVLSVVLLLISYLLSLIITKPVDVIKDSMEALQYGDFDTSIKLRRNDEIGSIINSFNFMASRLKNLIENLIEEERLRGRAEMNMLQYQINPHFLHNTLASIRMSSLMHGDKKTAKMLQVLSRLQKRVLSNCGDMISVEKEIINLEDYLYIQRLHYDDLFSVVYQLSDEAASCLIPSMLLQPLVENALYHGRINDRTLNIVIGSRLEGSDLYLWVADDGGGIPRAKLDELNKLPLTDLEVKDHLGIQNVMQRLSMNYGKECVFSIDSSEGCGTTVTIKIRRVKYVEDGTDCR